MVEHGEPHAGRHADRLVPEHGDVPAQSLHDPVGRDSGLVGIRLGKEDPELVPAYPREKVRLADAMLHGARHAFEQVVARHVAEGVVDVLEIVQVDHEHGARGAVPRHPLGLTGQFLLETAPVGEPGQEVVVDQVLEALRQLPPLGDVLDLGDDVEGLSLVVADERHGQLPPEVVAPRMAVALLDLIAGNPAVEQLAQEVLVEIDVLGMSQGPQRRRLEGGPGVTGDPAKRVVDLQAAALQVHECHPDRRTGERALEPGMHLVQSPLGRPPLALENLAAGNPATKLRVGRREPLVRSLVRAQRALERACRGPRADGLPRSPRPVVRAPRSQAQTASVESWNGPSKKARKSSSLSAPPTPPALSRELLPHLQAADHPVHGQQTHESISVHDEKSRGP